MGYRSVVSVYEIDVDLDRTRSSGRLPTSGICPACSMPLDNIVGAFAQDAMLAAAFALHLLTFIAAAALAGYWYRSAGRPPRSSNITTQFFGLRIALLFFVLSRFFAWVYAAVPNAMAVNRSYIIFYLVKELFEYASDTTLIWTLARTVCQPMVVANGYHRAKGVGLGFTITYGLFAGASWVFLGTLTGINLNQDWSDILYFGDGPITPTAPFTDLLLGCFGVLWGIVFFSLAIHALRKTKASLDTSYRIVPKIMVAASVLWTIRAGMTLVIELDVFDLVAGAGHTYSLTPLLQAVVVDIFGLMLFSLLFMCYRPHLAQLYSPHGGYPRSDDDTVARTSHVEPLAQKAHRAEPGIEMRGSYA